MDMFPSVLYLVNRLPHAAILSDLKMIERFPSISVTYLVGHFSFTFSFYDRVHLIGRLITEFTAKPLVIGIIFLAHRFDLGRRCNIFLISNKLKC